MCESETVELWFHTYQKIGTCLLDAGEQDVDRAQRNYIENAKVYLCVLE